VTSGYGNREGRGLWSRKEETYAQVAILHYLAMLVSFFATVTKDLTKTT
jgi:hypothetical protein